MSKTNKESIHTIIGFTADKVYTYKEVINFLGWILKNELLILSNIEITDLGSSKKELLSKNFLESIKKINKEKLMRSMFRLYFSSDIKYYINLHFKNNYDKKTKIAYNIGKNLYIHNDLHEKEELLWIDFIKECIIKFDAKLCYMFEKDNHDKLFKQRWDSSTLDNWNRYMDNWLYWSAFFLTYIRPYRVPIFGEEKLMKSPAYKVEKLNNGWILIQHTESIFDYFWPKWKQKLEDLEKLNDYLSSLKWFTRDERNEMLDEEYKSKLDDKYTLDYLVNH